MTDFLLELRSEEIPARMQAKAREDLARLFEAELAKAGLTAAEMVTYATPRRLALVARGLPAETAAVSEELKGPKTSAPPQALEGFLRKTGLAREQLVERDGVFFAVTERPGEPTRHILHNAIKAVVHAFTWPKSMRWGAESARTTSLRWVRPLKGIVAIFGDDPVEGEIELLPGIAGGDVVRFGAATLGHRFHHPGVITIGGAHDYVEKLRACHVIVDPDERAAIIRERAAALAAAAGLTLVEDEGLVAENAGLTEWPVPLLGRFDAAFLDVPPEVIQLTARVNQKYFVCRTPLPLAGGAGGGADAPEMPTPDPSRKREGKLANAFICTANIEATDGGAKIVEGNRKVLAARLADARFFYDTDLKVPLEEQAKKLDRIVFHEKLGTVADRVERVAKLARWLVEQSIVVPGKAGAHVSPSGVPSADIDPSLRWGDEERATLADMAERAARLCKADLVTGMVGEFPELQGLIGGYYAAAQGEPREVAEAIRDHYKPVGQGDEVPTAPVTVAVSLADKLDTLIGFFEIKERPTGSRDPFALRRAALGIVAIVLRNDLKIGWHDALMVAVGRRRGFGSALFHSRDDLLEFFADRLKVQQREAGVRHDLIDAVFALGGEDDLVRLLARVRALQAFVGTEDGANLLAGYKRAANILKKDPVTPAKAGVAFIDETPAFAGVTYVSEPAEAALVAALDAAEPTAAAAIAREDFGGAMAALATLRAPIDAFFEAVTVNDADPAKRSSRLALLARVRDAVHRVADFSRIEG